jgi:4-oxalocrotonate tautomerase family enzyme
MPYIQVDVKRGLTSEQRAELGRRIVEVVNDAIGSARAHINVAIREVDPAGLIEHGESPAAAELVG